jgi:peptidoglycan hydrolase-like protein with peptidoglycan-binding domain
MRVRMVGVLALGLLLAACGNSDDRRAGTGALGEADPGLAGTSPALPSEQLVRRAQSELKREGLYDGTVDGIRGIQTRQAITAFQQREGLQQNARIDPMTLRRMTLIALRMEAP